MLCEKATVEDIERLNKDKNYIWSVKYDGSRYLLFYREGKAYLINRQGKDRAGYYPDIIKWIEGQKKLNEVGEGEGEFVLDGEIITKTGKFTDVMHREGTAPSSRDFQAKMERYPCVFCAFDILYYKGEDLTDKPLRERLKVLDEMPGIRNIEKSPVFNDGRKLWDNLPENFEGIVAKNLNSRYAPVRSANWLKIVKTFETELVIDGFEEHSTWGFVLLSDKGNHRVSCPNEEDRKAVVEALKEGKKAIAEVVYKRGYENTGHLRQPTFKRLRVEGENGV